MEANRFGNWIPDVNRFGLPEPPGWALTKLYEFDHMLVLIPSRVKVKNERPAYLLCRRRQHSAGLGDVAMLDNKHPDTNMCFAHGVVPIGPLRFKRGTTWTAQSVDGLIAELKSRDTWALTGGPDGKDPDAAWKAVEDYEAGLKKKEDANLRDMFRHMAKDAWRSIKARTGQRSKNAWDGNRHARVGAKEQRRTIVPTARGGSPLVKKLTN
jgi:hypothetical protein